MTHPATQVRPYTTAEKIADGTIHLLGLAGATIGLAFLLSRANVTNSATRLVALIVYAVGLVGMLSASALYNLNFSKARRDVFRRLDHAMIFVMIAGSYTPFAISALPGGPGIGFCIIIWIVAAAGVVLRLIHGTIFDRIHIWLYLGMSWFGLVIIPPLATAVAANVLILLASGGVVYSLGILLHVRTRLFHNAAWHAAVVIAAGLHFAAIAQLPL